MIFARSLLEDSSRNLKRRPYPHILQLEKASESVIAQGGQRAEMLSKGKVFHILGLSCLGSAVFLMAYIFFNIAFYGGIICEEQNLFIVAWEVGMTGIAVVYFGYIFSKTLTK